ncbi:MAG: ATP-binding protein [Candidatus Riflebacteria bacterium]|nr:ATP-binding protein [Candidatus Riflebacteria bacterium]
MKNILLSQKHERDFLRKRGYTTRDGLNVARSAMADSLIKVIIGPRRAGKSVFALQMLEGQEFVYVNFDDDRLAGLRDFDLLLVAIAQVYGEVRTIFFDEIQNVTGWELLVNRLHRQGYNLLLTGSNAHLLSRELATHLTGRFREFHLLPFSLAEYLRAKGFALDDALALAERQGLLLNHFDTYLRQGGFPETVVGKVDIGNYLATLFESVLLKDVVKRYNIRFAGRLLELGRYLVANHAREYTFTSVAKALGFRSVHTLENYVSYLQEAFLLFSMNRFSWKAHERIQAPRKIYAYDTGFVGAVGFRIGSDKGRLLESVVAIELSRRGEEVYSCKNPNGKEVDFVIRQGGVTTGLIQVCYDLSDPRTRKREIAGLTWASSELGCDNLKILTWDEEETVSIQERKISLIPCWKWLLRIDAVPSEGSD